MDIEFKHYWEFQLADFGRYPFWICCELEDENQPWYAQIEPSVFRPYSERLPAIGVCGLVRTVATLKNGLIRDGLAFFNGTNLASPEIFTLNDRMGFNFNDTDGQNTNLNNATMKFAAEFDTELQDLFPIQIESVEGVLRNPSRITVQCFKSIATYDGSLSEHRVPDIAG